MTGTNRRSFLGSVGLAGVGLAAGCTLAGAGAGQGTGTPVTPAEVILYQHGLLHRLTIVLDKCVERLARGVPGTPSIVLGAGVIVDEFVEVVHEEIEERFIFKALEEAGRLSDLIAVLRKQHAAGRRAAARMINLAGARPASLGERAVLAEACAGYAAMYRAHAAREDTVLMREARDVLGANSGDELAKFARDKIGTGWYERILTVLGGLEEGLGIHDLDSFTVRI